MTLQGGRPEASAPGGRQEGAGLGRGQAAAGVGGLGSKRRDVSPLPSTWWGWCPRTFLFHLILITPGNREGFCPM